MPVSWGRVQGERRGARKEEKNQGADITNEGMIRCTAVADLPAGATLRIQHTAANRLAKEKKGKTQAESGR